MSCGRPARRQVGRCPAGGVTQVIPGAGRQHILAHPRVNGSIRVSLRAELRRFIVENYLLSRDESLLRDSDSLTAQGILDSTGALELALHLEKRYGVTVRDDELHPDNLDSIERIAAFIERKRA